MATTDEKLPKNTTLHDSKLDFKLSWDLFWRNIKAFGGIGVFSVISMLIMNIIVIFFVIQIQDALGNKNLTELLTSVKVKYLIISFLMFFLYAFTSSSYGLAYDIMSSGDGFAQFKGAFHYFLKYWWQYIVLSVVSSFIRLIFLFPQDLFPTLSSSFIFGILMAVDIANYGLWVCFNQTYPSITAQGSLKRAWKENFWILRKDFSRNLMSWGIFLMILIPIFVLSNLLIVYEINPDRSGLKYTLIGISYLVLIVSSIVMLGLKSLIATRIYNSYSFQPKNKRKKKNKDTSNVSIDSYF